MPRDWLMDSGGMWYTWKSILSLCKKGASKAENKVRWKKNIEYKELIIKLAMWYTWQSVLTLRRKRVPQRLKLKV